MTRVISLFENSADFFLEYGVLGLIAMAFMESSFFPIPPDIVLIPLALMNPGMALWYSLATTVASVIGGLFGYFIGCKAGRPLLSRYVPSKTLRKIDKMLYKYGGWAVAIAGFTPIPYKVFTIASGVSGVKIPTFIAASILGRGTRFFIEGLIIVALGEKAGQFLKRYFESGTITITLIIAIGFLAFRYKNWMKSTFFKGIYRR